MVFEECYDNEEKFNNFTDLNKKKIKFYDPFCPKCESENITLFIVIPYRKAIDKFAVSEGKLNIILDHTELDYDEEFNMFRCQDCDAEWKDITNSEGRDLILGCDEFEKDVISKLKVKGKRALWNTQ